jgi:O-antigen ligase
MPAEVVQRMADYDLDAYWAHNTYLELVVEHGIVGFVLYASIVIALFRLARPPAQNNEPRHIPFRSVWLIALGVYLFNALFVVMNYQFVNALIFTVAGILAAQNRQTPSDELLDH